MTENDNHLVFGATKEIVSRYFVVKEDGTKEPDHDLREQVKKASIALIRFFSDHKLLNVACFDEKGNFIDREYRRNDLTEDGFEMFRRGATKWLDSKGAQKEPPNYKPLEKILAQIRADK